MNRRTFLKSLAIACGATVVCPGGLLKSNPWIRVAALRKKNMILGKRIKLPWKHFQMTCYYNRDKLIKTYHGQYYETHQT